jgi:uncharacterized protein YyaL (SSP411 family)
VVKNVKQSGPWYANWALLMGTLSYGTYEVAIMGDESLKMNLELQSLYLPTSLFLGGERENLPLLKGKLVEGKTLIYVCRNKTCKLPVYSLPDALQQLN